MNLSRGNYETIKIKKKLAKRLSGGGEADRPHALARRFSCL